MEKEKQVNNNTNEAIVNDTDNENGLNNITQEMGETALENAMKSPDMPRIIGEIRERKTETSYTQADIDSIAEATGRLKDDPEVVKLNLALKYDQFTKYKTIWDNNESNNTFMQEGLRQDIATAQDELEEAMYLYDSKFAKYDEQERRNNLRYDFDRDNLKNKILETEDLAERSRLREVFKKKFSDKNSREYNLESKRADEASELSSERKDNADLSGNYGQLNIRDVEFGASKLENITDQIKNSEIYQTYELNKTATPDIKIRRQAGRVSDGDFVLIPHKPENISPELPPELPPVPPELPPELPPVPPELPPELPPVPPELPPELPPVPPERYSEQYKQLQENFAEALAKRRGIFGGGFGHAETLEEAKNDYVKVSAELLTLKYNAKLKELEGRVDLSDEDKINELNADAIKNKLNQDFELNDKIKDQIENGNIFRKIFNSVDCLPKLMRPFARAAGSNAFGILAWSGAAAIGLANPVVGAAIAVGTVAAFTRPGYGGSAFEAHKDVLNAAIDEKDKVVVDNGLARKKGESRDDYFIRLDDISRNFSARSKVNRAIQGLAEKESIQEGINNIEDIHNKDEVTRAFAGISNYLGREQIELSNYDKNKNRLTTGLLSVAAAALSVSGIHWGKMAIGKFGGAARYDKINMTLSQKETPSGVAVDNNTLEPEEPVVSEPIIETIEPVVSETEPNSEPSVDSAEPEAPMNTAESDQQETSQNENIDNTPYQSDTPENTSPNMELGYTEDQYKQTVERIKELRDSRDGDVYVSSGNIQRNLGVGVRVADQIVARMRSDDVIDGSGRVK